MYIGGAWLEYLFSSMTEPLPMSSQKILYEFGLKEIQIE